MFGKGACVHPPRPGRADARDHAREYARDRGVDLAGLAVFEGLTGALDSGVDATPDISGAGGGGGGSTGGW